MRSIRPVGFRRHRLRSAAPHLNCAVRVVARKLSEQEVVMDTSLFCRNPEVMGGALCFTGTRVLVKNLFD